MQKQTEHLELLKKYKCFCLQSIRIVWFLIFQSSIKTFQNVRDDILSKIADALDEVTYHDGECIVRQGAKGDTFYIVAKG